MASGHSPYGILGIDAAWTSRNPTGVALIRVTGSVAELVAVSGSYSSFCQANGPSPDCRAINATHVPMVRMLEIARELTAGPISITSVDMPLSTDRIEGRRSADDEVSKAFGKYGAGTHTPSADRPGQIGLTLHQSLATEGFQLALTSSQPPLLSLIECYPHPAIIRLLNLDRRLPYKISKARTYKEFGDLSIDTRREKIISSWKRISSAIDYEIKGTARAIDHALSTASRPKELKSVEDMLDAVICAWVGYKFAQREAEAFGGPSDAIWVPLASRPAT
jgi:predicted RNase H-like nuclease